MMFVVVVVVVKVALVFCLCICGCPLLIIVPAEEKRKNVLAWPPLIHFTFYKKRKCRNYVTRVVY
jgi:hypothetical protein